MEEVQVILTRGLRVTIPEPRGKKSRPTKFYIGGERARKHNQPQRRIQGGESTHLEHTTLAARLTTKNANLGEVDTGGTRADCAEHVLWIARHIVRGSMECWLASTVQDRPEAC